MSMNRVGTLLIIFPAVFIGLLLHACAAWAEAPGEYRIKDDSGLEIVLLSPARRVIPLYASFSECLVAMGCENILMARTVSDHTLPDLPVVGSHMNPNLELIVSQNPDLVLIIQGREEADELAARLHRLDIPTASFKIASFAELFSCIERLGILTGLQDNAAKLIHGIKSELALAAQPQDQHSVKPAVFFEVRYPNLLAAGMGNMASDIIIKAGGRPCLLEYPEKFVRLNEEIPILMNPDIYLIQKGPMNKSPLPLSARSHYKDLRSARNGFCIIVDEDLFSRPGPNSARAVKELSAIIEDWKRAHAAPRTRQGDL